jgi:flavin-dependent dehydrogenase
MASAFYRELEGGDIDAARTRFYLPLPDSDPGYAWVFPKRGSVQVGLGRLTHGRSAPLRRLLDGFIDADPELRDRARLRSRGGVIPVRMARRLARPGGVVIGDAAGLVNPITGGGLVYAVASGEMVARAVVTGWRRGEDREQVASRFASAWRWSIHAAWLAALSVPFHLLTNRVRRARPTHFSSFFRLYCVVLPRVTPAARQVTLRMRRASSARGGGA